MPNKLLILKTTRILSLKKISQNTCRYKFRKHNTDTHVYLENTILILIYQTRSKLYCFRHNKLTIGNLKSNKLNLRPY